jgi:hypothetical protein
VQWKMNFTSSNEIQRCRESWQSGKSRLDHPFSNRSLPSHCFEGKKASTVTNQF